MSSNSTHNNKQQKRKNNGYFVRNIQQYGEDFLARKTSKDFRRDAKYIFKDIAFSYPDDVMVFSKYFLNSTFVFELNSFAYEEWAKNNAISLGLSTYIQVENNNKVPIDPAMKLEAVLNQAKRSTTAYFIICRHLNNILTTFNNPPDNDKTLLMQIENELKALSNNLVKYRMDIL